MRRALALALCLMLAGCAAHPAHLAHSPQSLYDWGSIAALPLQSPVRVTTRYDVDGRLEEVTDSTLTIGVPPDMHSMTISRPLVVRVAILVPKRMHGRWLGKPLAAGVLAGLAGLVVGAVMRDGKVASTSLSVFALSSLGYYSYFTTFYFDHEWRVVYVRP